MKVCGILTAIQKKRNKEGKLFALMQLEDWYGSLEAMVFNTNFEALAPMLQEDKAVMVRSAVFPEEIGPRRLNVQDIVPMELACVYYPLLISMMVGV